MPALTREGVLYPACAQQWLTVVAAVCVSAAVVVVTPADRGVFPLQVAAILLACATATALDDVAHDIVEPVPRTLLRRRLTRLSVVAPVTVTTWLALLAWHGTERAAETVALQCMFAGLVGLCIAVAGVAVRRSASGEGSIAATPALIVALLASAAVPPRWRPLPLGDVPGGWLAIDLRWGSAAVIGALVFLASSRDRAGRAVTRRGRGSAA